MRTTHDAATEMARDWNARQDQDEDAADDRSFGDIMDDIATSRDIHNQDSMIEALRFLFTHATPNHKDYVTQLLKE